MELIRDAERSAAWFAYHHPEIGEEMRNSGGYVIFPSMDEWGSGFSGGRWGRGVAYSPEGTHIGWCTVNATNWGLQMGVHEYDVLLIFRDRATLEAYQGDALSPAISGMGVAGASGRSQHDMMDERVAIYHASKAGLMLGLNIGVEIMRYEPAALSISANPYRRAPHATDVRRTASPD